MDTRPSNNVLNFVQLLKNRSTLALSIALLLIITFITTASWQNSGATVHSPPTNSFESAQCATVPSPKDWKWDFARDQKNFVFTNQQCTKAFPRLYDDIERAVRDRKGKRITLEEVDEIPLRNGYVRGMIYNQQLYIIQTSGKIYSRGIATLLSLNRALTTSPEPLPNIEFTFSVDDWLPPLPQWALARKSADIQTWLMPDFGYWSWPETKVGSYGEIQAKAIEMEDSLDNPTGHLWPWEKKVPKVLWRGATMGLELREKLLETARDKSWADIKSLDWHNKESTGSDLKSMAEHCQFKYLLNTAGNSYSGRLKYLQNCRSVVLMHDDEWIMHHSHLMASSGPGQNFVQVKRDWSDLENALQKLVRDDKRAEKIAAESVSTFRERYLTPAAEACYWRQLIRRWRDVSFEPAFYTTSEDGRRVWRGVPVESYVLERRMEWDPY